MLKLTLLGSIELTIDQKPLADLRNRKAQAILYYLAVTAKPILRDAIIGLLWPEMNEKQAKSNLRVTLALLKREIGPYLHVTPTSLALNKQLSIVLDVETFRTDLATALSNQDAISLRTTLDYYQGEFLHGFQLQSAAPFEEWVLQERENLRLLAIQGLEKLTDYYIDQRNYSAGLAAGRQLLVLEPWHENAHRQVMQTLALSNQRTAALNQFEICQQQLQEALGVDPMPETLALYQKIKANTAEDAFSQLSLPQTEAQYAGHNKGSAKSTEQPHPRGSNLSSRPIGLEASLTKFVGRQAELAHIQQWLDASESRLLTIVGPGGMGKSRLAQEAAWQIQEKRGNDFPHGIYYVSLYNIDGAQDAQTAGMAIVTAIAKAVGCKLQNNTTRQAQLQTHLQKRKLLLILDNFEHLVAGAMSVLELLNHVPQLQILITSRILLRVCGENTLVLNKLSLPTPLQNQPTSSTEGYSHRGVLDREGTNRALLQREVLEREIPDSRVSNRDPDTFWQNSEAVTMFVQQAQSINRHFVPTPETIDLVTRICELVDGLPLGIELAAGWLHVISCEEIAREIEKNLDFLGADMQSTSRMQFTLRDVFERSWQLLADAEQMLMAKLAVFPSTFRRQAAEVVAGASLVSLVKLVNHSLLTLTADGVYIMHGSVHKFALEKLAQQPALLSELQTNHARFYLDFMAQKEVEIKRTDHGAAIREVTAEWNNIRTAWMWATAHQMVKESLQSLEGFGVFHELQGLFVEGIEIFTSSLERFNSLDKTEDSTSESDVKLLVGRLYSATGWFHSRIGRTARGVRDFQAGVSILRQINGKADLALGSCLFHWGHAIRIENPQSAVSMFEEAVLLLKKENDRWRLPIAWNVLGGTYLMTGQYDRAETCCQEGEYMVRQKHGPYGLDLTLRIMGRIKMARGQYAVAEEFCRASDAYAQKSEVKSLLSTSSLWLGEVYRLQGRIKQAQIYYEKSLSLSENLQHRFTVSQALWGLGCLAEGLGNYKVAKSYFLQSQAINPIEQWYHLQPTLGWALIGLGEIGEAKSYFMKVIRKTAAGGMRPTLLDAQVGLAYITGLAHRAQQDIDALHLIYHDPATTQETRDRVLKVSAQLGVSLAHGSPQPVWMKDRPLLFNEKNS